ncbi:MAG: FMN-binding negative transcriptional regulator [Alphaproteobacteria bacterium]|nr:FMN-binding negative transcriptional regulator [Alphaproteobacteria bacterium]
MHPSAAFHGGAARALVLARRYPFATLSVAVGGRVETVQAPIIPVIGAGGEVVAFEGHLARANRVFAALQEAGGEAAGTAVFSGPSAYISPSSYASKPTGKVVPTWNYLAAEAHGRMALKDSAEETWAIVERQTDVFEAGEAEPWAMSDGDADYMARLTAAIAGVRLEVERLEATEKLSQNKAEADRHGVIAALKQRQDENSRALAAHMSELERG